jgi:hypothetical protein
MVYNPTDPGPLTLIEFGNYEFIHLYRKVYKKLCHRENDLLQDILSCSSVNESLCDYIYEDKHFKERKTTTHTMQTNYPLAQSVVNILTHHNAKKMSMVQLSCFDDTCPC